jgi:hypothetical protein
MQDYTEIGNGISKTPNNIIIVGDGTEAINCSIDNGFPINMYFDPHIIDDERAISFLRTIIPLILNGIINFT